MISRCMFVSVLDNLKKNNFHILKRPICNRERNLNYTHCDSCDSSVLCIEQETHCSVYNSVSIITWEDTFIGLLNNN